MNRVEFGTKKISYVEIRSMIKYYWMKGKKPKVIMEKINTVYGKGTVMKSAVYKWCRRFRMGNMSIFDRERSGRRLNKTMFSKIKKLRIMRPWISAKTIAKQLGHHPSTTSSYLRRMQLQRVKVRCVPFGLTDSI